MMKLSTDKSSRKHLHAQVTPSLHLKDSKNGGKPGVGIDKHNISLFLNMSITVIIEKYPIFIPI